MPSRTARSNPARLRLRLAPTRSTANACAHVGAVLDATAATRSTANACAHGRRARRRRRDALDGERLRPRGRRARRRRRDAVDGALVIVMRSRRFPRCLRSEPVTGTARSDPGVSRGSRPGRTLRRPPTPPPWTGSDVHPIRSRFPPALCVRSIARAPVAAGASPRRRASHDREAATLQRSAQA